MKFLPNLLYLSGAEVASKVVTFAVVTYLARIAGPVGYGYVEFSGAVLLCAGLVVDQGFGLYGAREIAKAPQRTAALVSEIVVARFLLAVVAYAAMIGFALLLNRSSVVTRLILIYGLSLLISPLLLQWVFQGHNRMQPVAVMQCVRQVVLAAVVLTLVRDESQIWLVAVGEVIGACSAAVYGLWTYLSQSGGASFVSPAISWQLFRDGVPIGLSQLFWMIRMFGATVVVGIIATAQDLGYFGSAMRILVALHTFVWLYYFNLLPSLSRTWQSHDGSFAALVAKSLHGIAWISVIGGLLWVLAAPVAVSIVYGPGFSPAGVVLQWLAGVGVAAALSGHYRFGLIAAGQQNVEMIIGALAAVCAAVSIPIGYAEAGPRGAAMGLLATELLVWWMAWWWSTRHLGLSSHLRYLVRPFIAVTLCVILLRLLPPTLPPLNIALVVPVVAIAAYIMDPAVRERCWQIALAGRPWVRRQLTKTVRGAV